MFPLNVLYPPSELRYSNEVKQMGKEIPIVPHAVLLCLRFKCGIKRGRRGARGKSPTVALFLGNRMGLGHGWEWGGCQWHSFRSGGGNDNWGLNDA